MKNISYQAFRAGAILRVYILVIIKIINLCFIIQITINTDAPRSTQSNCRIFKELYFQRNVCTIVLWFTTKVHLKAHLKHHNL